LRVRIEPAESEPEIAAARELFIEYASALRIDLGFQDFEVEVAALPGRYAPPSAGSLLCRFPAVGVQWHHGGEVSGSGARMSAENAGHHRCATGIAVVTVKE